MQLFIESLALAGLGAAGGLLLARLGLARLQSLAREIGGVRFWIEFELSVETALYALGLTVVAAAGMGVLPGLKATGRRAQTHLRELDGRTASRLGPVWMTLVVAQVAVGVLPTALSLAWQVVQMEVVGPGFAADRFVVGTAALGNDTSEIDATRTRRRQIALTSRLEAEAGVSSVTIA